MSTKPSRPQVVDFRAGPVPSYVRELIATQLAIEAEDAKSAGALGYMARALVVATMPYKDPKADAFTRQNGDFRLRIVAGYEGGIPYGIYPRLLLSWVATEAVRKQSPVIELGDSLRIFLREVLDLRSSGGGARGSASRVTEQMKRLFGSLVTAQYSGTQQHRGFVLRNVLIADGLELDEAELADIDRPEPVDQPAQPGAEGSLWTPQAGDEAGQWRSKVRLSQGFFTECIENPVPIDLRAYKSLRDSPLAMDVYTWLTYRMSYTQRRTKPMRWESLMGQFGSGFNLADPQQAKRDFKKAFLRALKAVLVVYPEAKIEVTETGLVLLPSRPHIPPASAKQPELF
jgi:hypothetical protein